MANYARGDRLRPDAKVHIGSVAKTMIALGVLRLMTLERVDLDAPLSQLLLTQKRFELPGFCRQLSSIGVMLAGCMEEYPHIQVHLEATNRCVGGIDESIDIAMCLRTPPLEDSHSVTRIWPTARNVWWSSQ